MKKFKYIGSKTKKIKKSEIPSLNPIRQPLDLGLTELYFIEAKSAHYNSFKEAANDN